MKDYYVILGVDRDAAKKDIKRAYRDSVKKHHPDCCVSSADPHIFRDIIEAYEILGDHSKRKEYDKQFRKETSPGSSFERSNSQHFTFKKNARVFNFNKPAFSEPVKSKLYCTVHLTAHQLSKDVQYPYNILYKEACSNCRQQPGKLLFYCPECSGVGYKQQIKELVINVPKGTEHGTRAKISLDHVGLSGAVLIVTISVEDDNRQEIWTIF
ncbi:MAG: DnaJ domain-containing protein [Proteobacteria bacterium]|nr:DnaJ domain-containing protein [Pseudomonadota bacterium]